VAIPIAKIFNFEKYPLGANSSQLQETIARCQQQLQTQGAFVLPDFIQTEALAALLSEVTSVTPTESEKNHTVFQLPPDPAFAADHPRNTMVFARIGFVGRSLLPSTSLLNLMYDWDPLKDFLSAIVGRQLYRSNDNEGSVRERGGYYGLSVCACLCTSACVRDQHKLVHVLTGLKKSTSPPPTHSGAHAHAHARTPPSRAQIQDMQPLIARRSTRL
jgi:hypothetical protein